MTDIALHKLRFQEGTPVDLVYPLKEIPAVGSKLHSPRIGKQNGIRPFDFTKYRQYTDEVVEIRLRLAKGEYPHDILAKYFPSQFGRLPSNLPTCLSRVGVSTSDVKTCASLVRMDTPVDLGVEIMRWLRDKGALKPKVGSQHVQFIETFPEAQRVLATKVLEALDRSFETKYYFGVARPAHAYEHIYSKKGDTIFEYRHPTHPSYSAGHGAAAGATAQFFYDYFDLKTEDWIEIRTAAYLFAMYRSFAGVHYTVDNLAGLQVGGLDVGYKL